MTEDNLTPQRFRRAMELLSEPAPPAGRKDLWEAVAAEFPLSDYEQELQSGRLRGLTDWLWQTTGASKAGWLLKDGRGGWTITPEGREGLAAHSDPADFKSAVDAAYRAWSTQHEGERLSALARGIVPADENQERVVEGARLFVDRGLNELDSVFAPGRGIWRAEVTDELVTRFVQSDGSVGGNFDEKIAHQLSQATDDARLLMAELVAFQLLPASTDTIGEAKKAQRVQNILDLMAHPVQIPDEVLKAFAGGSFNPGMKMATALGSAMTILVNFAHAWVGLDADVRTELLEDPWEFRAFVNAVPGENFPSQRLSLMYLVHPETFTSIVQGEARRRIRETFIGETGREPGDDLDLDLRDIWVALQVKNKRRFHFWMPEFLSRWSPTGAQAATTAAEPSGEDESPIVAEIDFPAADDSLADDLLIARPWLQEVLDLLRRRRQVIFYGPPGTGKTFLAKALARHAAGGRDPVIVQFHPSYSYEDFVAGYRPYTQDGVLTYRLQDGPLLRLADLAARNPDQAHFLVIDEINRGNLAKVFGELYFLLEYRDESIELLYGSEDGARMALPGNVFIIGTMNTADRSIALLDAAMRRRFAFVELHPDQQPTKGLLRAWLARQDLSDEPAQLLEALNEQVHDRDARIGPSYLMPSDHDLSEVRLQQIWRYEILPLLEETHFGDGRDIASEFGLEALRRRRPNVDRAEASIAEDEDDSVL